MLLQLLSFYFLYGTSGALIFFPWISSFAGSFPSYSLSSAWNPGDEVVRFKNEQTGGKRRTGEPVGSYADQETIFSCADLTYMSQNELLECLEREWISHITNTLKVTSKSMMERKLHKKYKQAYFGQVSAVILLISSVSDPLWRLSFGLCLHHKWSKKHTEHISSCKRVLLAG